MMELGILAIVVVAAAVVSIRIGILVAPRLAKWTERDEEPHDRVD